MAKPLRAKPIIDRAEDLLANGRLRPGRKTVRGWDVCFHNCGIEIFGSSPAGTVIRPTGTGHIDLGQSVRARPNRRYRLDIHVEPLKRSDAPIVAGSVQSHFGAFKAEEQIRTHEPPAMHVGGDAPVIHRAVFQCPAGTGRLQVRLRFRAEQAIIVQRIRLVETGDYMLTSHPLANTPQARDEPPPQRPGSVILCDGRKNNRPLLGWLRQTFGERQVQRLSPRDVAAEFERPGSKGDRPAVVIDLAEDCSPLLEDLLAWSNRSIVIASLATFAGAASRAGHKDIRIQDRTSGLDMPCGEIAIAGYFTRGFALADAIPYAWNDGRDDFAHRYLTMPKETRKHLAEMGIRPAIFTECGQREVDHHPLVLYRPGKHGALLVMDPDGLETASAGEEAEKTFDLLWRAALGRETVTLGQFAAPPTHYEGVMVDLVEVAKHYEMMEDMSILARVRGGANMPPTWMVPARRHDRLAERPTLHIRTGFAETDWPAVYGLLLWLKRMALESWRDEPAARAVLKRMRVLAWPLTQPHNWRGCPRNVVEPRSDLPADAMIGRIDLQVGSEPQTVIVVPDRHRAALVRPAIDRRYVRLEVSPAAFVGERPAQPRHDKQLLCKVLLPGVPQPWPANSPILTDLAATLLERLAFGLAGLEPPDRSCGSRSWC